MLALRFQQNCDKANSPLDGLILNNASDLVVGSNFAGSHFTKLAAKHVLTSNFNGSFFANNAPERFEGLISGSWQCPLPTSAPSDLTTLPSVGDNSQNNLLFGVMGSSLVLMALYLLYRLVNQCMPRESNNKAEESVMSVMNRVKMTKGPIRPLNQTRTNFDSILLAILKIKRIRSEILFQLQHFAP